MGTSAKGKAGPITGTGGQAFQPDWGKCWVSRPQLTPATFAPALSSDDAVWLRALAAWRDLQSWLAMVQRPHDADPRKQYRAVQFRDQDQGFHGRLPLWSRVLSVRKLRDVVAGVPQCEE